jgi:hypothetical protein
VDVDHRLDAFLCRTAQEGNAAQHQPDEERRHERALGIVEEEAVAQRGFAVRRGTERASLLHEVLDDGAGLGDDAAVVLDDRGLAEGVDGPKIGRGEEGRLVPS